MITEVKIKNFETCGSPKRDFHWKDLTNMNILTGMNGTGKSLLFKIIRDTLNNQVPEFSKFSDCEIVFNNETEKSAEKQAHYMLFENYIFDVEMLQLEKKIYKSNHKTKKNIEDTVNSFLSQINMQVKINSSNIDFIENNRVFNVKQVSGGIKQLLYIVAHVALIAENKGQQYILLDLPETRLGINWQGMLLKQLTAINPQAQFFVITHSPAIIMNGWNDVFQDIKDITI